MNGREISEPTRYDRRMRDLMNRREAQAFYATAARRRLVVGAHIVLTVVGTASCVGTYSSDVKWPLFVLFGVLLPWCVATALINGATRGLLELRVRALDERQRLDRDRVLARAHRATFLLLVVAALVIVAVGVIRDEQVAGAFVPVLIAVIVVHWLMPLWTAGLLVKDEPADD